MGRPLVAPPGLDPRVAVALRQAFADAMHDPELIAEGARMDLELGFVPGADVQAMVERLYKSPPDVIARARKRSSRRISRTNARRCLCSRQVSARHFSRHTRSKKKIKKFLASSRCIDAKICYDVSAGFCYEPAGVGAWLSTLRA